MDGYTGNRLSLRGRRRVIIQGGNATICVSDLDRAVGLTCSPHLPAGGIRRAKSERPKMWTKSQVTRRVPLVRPMCPCQSPIHGPFGVSAFCVSSFLLFPSCLEMRKRFRQNEPKNPAGAAYNAVPFVQNGYVSAHFARFRNNRTHLLDRRNSIRSSPF